ncbi:MAG: replication-associated recombination protein A [Candidatus Taylorbacteria bacterium]|nr:replication-associated recombination protein A [Candidatus Taylorbacteria bacterium]
MEPLAAKIRPKKLSDFVGQEHLTGPSKPLRAAVEKKHLFSFVLWGPPGSGKTTLARIYAKSLDAELHELSAVSAGKDDIKKIVGTDRPPSRTPLKFAERGVLDAEAERGVFGAAKSLPLGSEKVEPFKSVRPKVLFLDEIHRFNKAQQDFLLPHVESGELTLIGATTENPSFEIIAPLLSRCRVFVLNPHSEKEMGKIIKRAVPKIKKDALEWLVAMADGDARQAISVIEAAQQLYGTLTVENLKNAVQSKFLRYDKKGEEHYNIISAFIKSMRAGQADAAMYYLVRMLDAGEDPKFIARRMVIFASEDIGLAQPTALVVANEIFQAVDTIGLPEAAINLAHGVAYLSNSKKDRSAYNALQMAMADVKKYGSLPVPLKIRNAVTKLMDDIGYGQGYHLPAPGEARQAGKYPSTGSGQATESYLPDKIKEKKYFKP